MDGWLEVGALLTDLVLQKSSTIDPTIWVCRRLLGNPPVEERTSLALAFTSVIWLDRSGLIIACPVSLA